MKTVITAIFVLISLNAYSQTGQTGWVNLGKEIGFEFYYIENTIVKGPRPSVVVAGIPQQEYRDQNNDIIKYVTIFIIFYKSDTGIRCMLTNHMYFYDDRSYKKANLPKRDVPISYYTLLSKLYNIVQ